MPRLYTIRLPYSEADLVVMVRGLRRRLRKGNISDLEIWKEDGTWYAQWYD